MLLAYHEFSCRMYLNLKKLMLMKIVEIRNMKVKMTIILTNLMRVMRIVMMYLQEV